MTANKSRKLRKIENAIRAVEQGTYSFACVAFEEICGVATSRRFEKLFRPEIVHHSVWTFGDAFSDGDFNANTGDLRLFAMCLFYEMVRAGR